MSNHNWMRQSIVDIMQYLPAFLSNSQQFKAANDADSKEHDTIRIDLQDVLDQFYVKSATWGLERWEELCGISIDKTLSDSMRRNAIIAKLQNPGSVTEVFLTNLINRYIADKQGYIISYPCEYRIEVLYHGGQITDYEKLRTAISTYIPAHIGYNLVTITKTDLEYHGAGTVQCYRKNFVDMSVTYNISVDDSQCYVAGIVVHNYKLIKISGGNKWLNLKI
ncbi:putative phage tail protein [uncultured Veillonella sp.]|uniref:putative phage tail protein n=1 Tax=uncultured Veillonella sp. TaxID=159268 RepID=UPI002596B66D|nr:putative phage tail protein [uncultured Veillonella sp.]